MKKQAAMTYKRKFLKFHRISVNEFEKRYIAFMETNPDEKAYREFAKKWGFDILPGLGNSELEAVLSVNLNVMKILSNSEAQAQANIFDVMKYFK